METAPLWQQPELVVDVAVELFSRSADEERPIVDVVYGPSWDMDGDGLTKTVTDDAEVEVGVSAGTTTVEESVTQDGAREIPQFLYVCASVLCLASNGHSLNNEAAQHPRYVDVELSSPMQSVVQLDWSSTFRHTSEPQLTNVCSTPFTNRAQHSSPSLYEHKAWCLRLISIQSALFEFAKQFV